MPVIRFRSYDGTEIYEGPGHLWMTMEGDRPRGRLRIDRGDMHRNVDLTDLLRSVPYRWTVHYAPEPLEWVTEPDPMHIPQPQVFLWELEIDLPRSAALALREHVLEGAPVRPVTVDVEFSADRIRSAMAEVRQRYIERGLVPRRAWEEEFFQHAGPAQPLEDPTEPGPRPEYDELIESTRSEFPHDPFNYGRIHPEGPHRWTPPAEGEKVARCP